VIHHSIMYVMDDDIYNLKNGQHYFPFVKLLLVVLLALLIRHGTKMRKERAG